MVHPGDVELLPRWRIPAEIAFMGTPTGPSGPHGFPLAMKSSIVN